MQLETKRGREKLCNGEEEIFETIVAEKFPNLMEISTYSSENFNEPLAAKAQRQSHLHTTKLLKTKNKEKNLKTTKGKKYI